MRICAEREGLSWLTTKGVTDPSRKGLANHFKISRDYAIPKDSGRKTALSSFLANSLIGESEGLLWFKGYGIWPSSENWELFNGYRKSIGEFRSISEAPCHFFLKDDLKSLECLLAIGLYFFWDVLVFDCKGELVVSLSHDEIMTFKTRNEQKFVCLGEQLEKFGRAGGKGKGDRI